MRLSVSPSTSPNHCCDDHAHDGHHHMTVRQAPTPGHYLPHNPCDDPDFSEICVCCRTTVDLDEAVAMLAAAPNEGIAHNHSHLRPKLPVDSKGWAVAGVTAWATVPGLIFGVQNYQGARKTSEAIKRTLALLKAQPEFAVAPNDEARNREAYKLTLQQSLSMQHFVGIFAGLLPFCGSALILGGIVAPALGVAGSCFLVVYCISHFVRYMTYEWPRFVALQNRMQIAEKTKAALDTSSCLGLEASKAMLQQRVQLYPTVSAAFALYGLGATMMPLATLFAPAVLMPVGAGCLAVGMSAVLYLNNGPIKAAFGKNQDRDINRRTLGNQQDILRRVASLCQEEARLRELQRGAQARSNPILSSPHLMGLALKRGLTAGVSYGLTFGLMNMGRDDALSALRRARIASIQQPQALLGETEKSGQDNAAAYAKIYQMLHERPDQVAHQKGALLDHLHARVALEGLSL